MPKRNHEECVASDLNLASASVPEPPASVGPRRVLSDFSTLDKLLDSLRTCKRIIVVTGAGIRQERWVVCVRLVGERAEVDWQES